jgi:hypothetical protein
MHPIFIKSFVQFRKWNALHWVLIVLSLSLLACNATEEEQKYILKYDEPAPNRGGVIRETDKYYPYDYDWENWSLPLGNGYIGANIFGRTDTERVQITENTLSTKGLYGGSSLTNFAEIYIDFKHDSTTNYERSLVLNEGLSKVSYESGGTNYSRVYFTSYPDKVMVIKLSADRGASLSFTLRPAIPYKKPFGEASDYAGKTGKVTAEGDLITLSGSMEYIPIEYEGQVKLILHGGSMQAENNEDNDEGKITVNNADSAMILIAAGTNYQLKPEVFLAERAEKLAGNPYPHAKVSSYIQNAASKSYAEILAAHLADYRSYFGRVDIHLGSTKVPDATTDQLLANYKEGVYDPYLEELYFQFGRYLLISSSRENGMPSNLQGIWNQYDLAPWTSGYWHNINVQMNYWPAFNTNLAEMFQAYVSYNEAFRKKGHLQAMKYLSWHHKDKLSSDTTENGWIIGTGASPYHIGSPGGHSGPGTGGLTTKLFWDYYEFTGDTSVLKQKTYPAILGMGKFLSKVLLPYDSLLLTSPSASPEQLNENGNSKYYTTVGCAFDQQMIYENHGDILKAAGILGEQSGFIDTIREQIAKLDPVQVGWSGQIKEYREEKYYGEIGEYNHRHISQLVGLYPGTIINSNTPAWLDAAKVTLALRGDESTGWAMAHRLNLWARAGEGERAYRLYQTLLKKGTLDNLFDTHPPFQIDGNFGGTAGVAEMLLQSHEGYISLLPSIPEAWNSGSYSGLVARGNFEVSAKWNNGQASEFKVLSRGGNNCKVKYFNIAKAIVTDSNGKKLRFTSESDDVISFPTIKGEYYTIKSIPGYTPVNPPAGLTYEIEGDNAILNWEESVAEGSYNLYLHEDNAPDYLLVQEGIRDTNFNIELPGLKSKGYEIIRLTFVSKSGRESQGLALPIYFTDK